ncbi:MAG: hypothetical protein ABIS14_08865 [Sphingomonas sp.]
MIVIVTAALLALAAMPGAAPAKALVLLPKLQQSMAAHGRELGQEAGREAGVSALRRAEQELLSSPARRSQPRS